MATEAVAAEAVLEAAVAASSSSTGLLDFFPMAIAAYTGNLTFCYQMNTDKNGSKAKEKNEIAKSHLFHSHMLSQRDRSR